MREIPLERARRMAIAAQGLHRPRPSGRVDLRHLRKVMADVGVLQVDSVNVVARAHRLTLFSRLGGYPGDLLDRAFEGRELFEYWAHVASLVPIEDWPLFLHRMERMGSWRRYEELQRERPGFVEEVLDEIGRRGALSVGDLTDTGERAGPWWGWSHGKVALEWLFAKGKLTVSHRHNFTRYYDLPERVIPDRIRAVPAPGPEEANRRLLLKGAAAMGVATAKDIADYYRVNIQTARPLIDELAAEGSLLRARVEGWKDDAFVDPEAAVPRETMPMDDLVALAVRRRGGPSATTASRATRRCLPTPGSSMHRCDVRARLLRPCREPSPGPRSTHVPRGTRCRRSRGAHRPARRLVPSTWRFDRAPRSRAPPPR